jgi:hypothetical protein
MQCKFLSISHCTAVVELSPPAGQLVISVILEDEETPTLECIGQERFSSSWAGG